MALPPPFVEPSTLSKSRSQEAGHDCGCKPASCVLEHSYNMGRMKRNGISNVVGFLDDLWSPWSMGCLASKMTCVAHLGSIRELLTLSFAKPVAVNVGEGGHPLLAPRAGCSCL